MQGLNGQLGHGDGVIVTIGDVQDILGMQIRKRRGEGEGSRPWKGEVSFKIPRPEGTKCLFHCFVHLKLIKHQNQNPA